ncbi:MAG: DUF2304 domain-containing protein [Peptococcaceae bacterium]|nr:DUF2304 domain-containing protein [Peptococcaceae bacterium]
MSEVLRIIILAMGALFVLLVFYLLVTRKIDERASLPWIATSMVMILLALIPSILQILASSLLIDYPPALLFLISNFVIFLLLLYQSIQISALQNKCKELAQNLSIINSTGIHIPKGQNLPKRKALEHFYFRNEKNVFLSNESKINIPF